MVPVVLKIIVPQAECHVKKILALCFIGLMPLKKKKNNVDLLLNAITYLRKE